MRKWWELVGVIVLLALPLPEAQGRPCAYSLSIHTPLKYHLNPAFEKEDAILRFTRFSVPPLSEVASKKKLADAEEVEWFLRYNFLKYRAHQLLNENRNPSEREALISEATALLELAGRVRQYLQMKNQGLIGSVVKRFNIHTVSNEELFSEGQVTMVKAIDSFDVSFGYKFSTYASRCLIREFSKVLQKTSRRLSREQQVVEHLQNASSVLDKAVEGERAEAYYDERQEEIEETVAALLPTLDARQREIIAMRFGLFGQEPKTLQEVATIVGRCKERVRQIESKALEKMREQAELRRMESDSF